MQWWRKGRLSIRETAVQKKRRSVMQGVVVTLKACHLSTGPR